MNSPHSAQQFENYYFMIPIYFAIPTLQSEHLLFSSLNKMTETSLSPL